MRFVSVDTCGKIAMPALPQRIPSTGILQKSPQLQVDFLHTFHRVDVSSEKLDAKLPIYSRARERRRICITHSFFATHRNENKAHA